MSTHDTFRAVIEHSDDGTLVTGTSREDREVVEQLKRHGFRWSRRLEAWYLPRNWTEPTRAQRVTALQASLPGAFEVQRSDTPRRPAAERETERQTRAAHRAERLDRRAEAAQQRADASYEAAKDLADRIPLGQPILLGHHSQRRHERDLDRINRGIERSYADRQLAEDARAGAARARVVAAGQESIVTIGNRIDRTQAEIRRITRFLETAGGTYQDRATRQLDELRDQLDHDQAKLAAAGGVPYSRDNVKPGDFVRVRGQWFPVVRANAKTVTVPSPLVPATSRATDTTPWREINDHIAHDDATRAHIADMIRATSPAFPGLRERLARAGEAL
jgi:hypothetical protein